jgi:hypothetical protein
MRNMKVASLPMMAQFCMGRWTIRSGLAPTATLDHMTMWSKMMSAHYRLRLLYDADLLQLMPMPPQDKKVSDVMTPAQRVFMLEASLCLDYEVMLQIYKSGYTRIPVYEGQTYCYSQPVDIARHRNLCCLDQLLCSQQLPNQKEAVGDQ